MHSYCSFPCREGKFTLSSLRGARFIGGRSNLTPCHRDCFGVSPLAMTVCFAPLAMTRWDSQRHEELPEVLPLYLNESSSPSPGGRELEGGGIHPHLSSPSGRGASVQDRPSRKRNFGFMRPSRILLPCGAASLRLLLLPAPGSLRNHRVLLRDQHRSSWSEKLCTGF